MIERICIAGKNRIAIDALQYARQFLPDDRILVVCNVNDDGVDMWQPSLRKFADQTGLPILTLGEAEAIENMLFLSVEFDRIIRTGRFQPNSTLINIHFSELPAYKGMYTSCLPILHGQETSGCTLHTIDDGIDTGAIIAKTRFELSPNETAKTLYGKYLYNGSQMIGDMMEAMLTRKYTSYPQIAQGSTYFSKSSVDYANLTVDLKVTAEQLSRQVRAYNHRSYQLPSVFGQSISRCTILPQRSTVRPGTLIERTDDATIVATIDFDCMLIHDRFEDAEDAVMRDDARHIQSILARDPSLAIETNACGWSLIARAAYNGHDKSLATLLAYGTDPDLPNGKGTTPLMYAKDRLLMAHDARPAMRLLAAGANPNARDYRGRTLFDYMTDEERHMFLAATQLAS